MTERFTFAVLPQTRQELEALPEFSLDTPFKTAALAVAALARYETSPDECFDMLNALYGPVPVSEFQKQFIRDRLRSKAYVVRSYFDGATPENGYTPGVPYAVSVSDNPYSYPQEGYATLFLKSSGADSPRQIKLRFKPSEGRWYVIEMLFLGDVRAPAELDPWA